MKSNSTYYIILAVAACCILAIAIWSLQGRVIALEARFEVAVPITDLQNVTAKLKAAEDELMIANAVIDNLVEYNNMLILTRDHYRDKWQKQEGTGKYADE